MQACRSSLKIGERLQEGSKESRVCSSFVNVTKTYESSFLPCLVNIYGRHASNYRSPTLIRRFKSTRTEDKLYNF